MRQRPLVASLLLLFGLTLVALPAEGRPSTTAATTPFTDNGDCTVTVTYTWSGFTGHNLIADYGVRWPADTSGSEFSIEVLTYNVPGSGTLSHTFDFTGEGSHTYYGRGKLITTKLREISGSDAMSPRSANLGC